MPDIAGYRILSLIAQGGMGKVYKAVDENIQRPVAVKLLQSELLYLSKTDASLIQDEARALAQVNHPNVMQVFELAEYSNGFAIVGEYIDGTSLTALQTEKVLTLEHKLGLLKQIADGMQAVHDAGLMHGDLKASNVLVNNAGQAKVIDFGLAFQFAAPGNASISSQHYSLVNMAPEQWKAVLDTSDPSSEQVAKPVSKAADVFAFGVLAYELIAGYSPYGTSDVQALKERVTRGQFSDACDIYPKLPQAISDLLNQLLQTEPEHRPGSFSVISDCIQRSLQGMVTAKLLEQQTVTLDSSLKENKAQSAAQARAKSLHLGIASVLFFALLMSAAGLLFWPQEPFDVVADEPHYVAVLRPKVLVSELPDAQQQVLVAAMDDTLRQSVIRGRNTQLLPQSEYRSDSLTITDIVIQTSATEVVQPEMQCFDAYCDITLKVFRDGDWQNPQLSSWVMQTYALGESILELQSVFAQLLPEVASSITATGIEIADVDYQAFLSIYIDVFFKGDESRENLRRLQVLLEKAPSLYSAYSLYRRIALYLYRSENDGVLLDSLKQVLKRAPSAYRNSLQFTIDMLWIALYQDDRQGAEELLKQARNRGADTLTLAELRASYFLENEQPEQAIEHYQQALALRFSANNQFNLALSYWYLGEYEKVVESLKKLIAITPESYQALQLLGSVYLVQGQLELAIEVLAPLTVKTPQSMDLNNLAIAYSLKREFQLAQAAALSSAKLSPNMPSVIFNLADIEWYLGNIAQAQTYYQEVLQKVGEDDSLSSLLLKAQAWAHLGEPRKAITMLNQANQLVPNNGEVAFISALVYVQINEKVSSVAKVEQALKEGVGEVWFNLPWFDELCSNVDYRSLFKTPPDSCR
ncbi:protein kinase [Paraneptunicella aestuarii]|uniref:serine/threonine-protein kinase n=1 Tax=Paraneptunicella aestuarii TaxID=2831148 RepID=UPI001E4EEDF0|nr:serine/threonine-protein kinase [Paraneptunicella aestuarii]UAA39306.1 protein kinase [Paraneptunicella aestuarii]